MKIPFLKIYEEGEILGISVSGAMLNLIYSLPRVQSLVLYKWKYVRPIYNKDSISIKWAKRLTRTIKGSHRHLSLEICNMDTIPTKIATKWFNIWN